MTSRSAGIDIAAAGGHRYDRDKRLRRARGRRQAPRHDGARPLRHEETLPAGTKSLFHLHRDSDEVAWVLAGEMTFKIGDDVRIGGPGSCAFFPRNVPHAWKNSGSDTARVLFLYTPAAAGGYVEELSNRRGQMTDDERTKLREHYRWEVVGPNPL